MEEEQLRFDLLNRIQSLADEGKLSGFVMVTGFTVLIEGVNNDSNEQTLMVTGPYDYITKTLGHVEYLRLSVARQVGGGEPLD